MTAPSLFLHGREIGTVFDLLGDKENDLTYALGWALSRSPTFLGSLLPEILGEGHGEPLAIRLQEFGSGGGGFTDVEVQTADQSLVVEAKRGWALPSLEQLQKYAPRIQANTNRGAILVVSECTAAYAEPRLPKKIGGIPVVHWRWRKLARMAAGSAATTKSHAEKRELRQLDRYFRRLMTMQNTDSNLVYVVSLAKTMYEGFGLSFDTIVMKRDRYFHPVGGKKGGWPKEPPNYLGFRFDGRLQRVSHVEDYTISTKPSEEIAEVSEHVDWSDEPHYIYTLGPSMTPNHEVKTGKLYRAQRVWVALDLLLTCDTIAEARDLTKARWEETGTS